MPSSSTTPTSDCAKTMALVDVLRALRLDHPASILDAATSKAITRNDSPNFSPRPSHF